MFGPRAFFPMARGFPLPPFGLPNRGFGPLPPAGVPLPPGAVAGGFPSPYMGFPSHPAAAAAAAAVAPGESPAPAHSADFGSIIGCLDGILQEVR